MPNVCEFGFANLFGSSCNSTGWLSFHFLAIFWPTFFLLFFSQYIYTTISLASRHLIVMFFQYCYGRGHAFFCMQKSFMLYIKLVAGDILAPTSMKNAANCDT